MKEIPPGFTHALMLRNGTVVAQGPLERVVTQEHLSETFGMPLVLTYAEGRFAALRRAPMRAQPLIPRQRRGSGLPLKPQRIPRREADQPRIARHEQVGRPMQRRRR